MFTNLFLLISSTALASTLHLQGSTLQHATSHANVNNNAAIPSLDHGHEKYYPNHYPKYEFNYGVDDQHTGDNKGHRENRDGGVVRGQYMLVQPDGRLRTVEYTADKISGFNAQVTFVGQALHPSGYHH